MKYKKSFLLRKYKKFFHGFHFLKYKNSFFEKIKEIFFGENIRILLKVESESSIFVGWIFFLFELGVNECATELYIILMLSSSHFEMA